MFLAQIGGLVTKADAADSEDDDQFGDRHGDELPGKLAGRDSRIVCNSSAHAVTI